MSIRRAGFIRMGFRRLGGGATSSGLPYSSPLVPDAVVTINHSGTTATTSAALLFNPSGEGSLAILFDGTTYNPVTDRAALLVKKTSGVQSAVFDAGGDRNLIELRNGGGASRDIISSTNPGGFGISGAAAGFNNCSLAMDPGTPGNSFMTLTADQLSFQSTRVGFLGAAGAPVPARAKTTAGPAGGTYNATVQAMVNDCFNTLKGLGFLV